MAQEGKQSDEILSKSRLDVLMTAMNKLIINVTSIGNDDYALYPSQIMINGKNFVQNGRGVHVLDIDVKSLSAKLYGGDQVICIDEIDLEQYTNYAKFDTWGNQQAGKQFMEHLQSIKNANIIIIVISNII